MCFGVEKCCSGSWGAGMGALSTQNFTGISRHPGRKMSSEAILLEASAEICLDGDLIIQQFVRSSFRDHLPFGNQIASVGGTEPLTYVVVGYQDADPGIRQFTDIA